MDLAGPKSLRLRVKPWVVRRALNDVESVSVFCEGNAIWSKRNFLMFVEDNSKRLDFGV
jgi:hypothetical protein